MCVCVYIFQAKLRVYNSRWTRSFSMDTVASNGVVICNEKERNKKYQVCNRESRTVFLSL